MRRLAFALLMLSTMAAHAADITFVWPLPGSQAIGAQALEITTTATNVDRVEFYIDDRMAGVARHAPWRVATDFGTTLDVHRITAKVYSDRYQKVESASIMTAAIAENDVLDVTLVEVPMRVHSARPVTAADLRVRENGVEQKIREVQSTRGKAHFAFVVDRSLSMAEARLPSALRAVKSSLAQLRPGDTASIVLFNHQVMRPRPITRDDDLAAMFATVNASGGTSLRDAVATAVGGNQRTYVIVITDGGDKNSALDEESALQRISGRRTIIDAVVLGSRSSFLTQAATNTGGEVVRASAATLDQELRDLLNRINSGYLLAYQSAGTKKGWRRIDIRTQNRGVRVVNARKGYFAP